MTDFSGPPVVKIQLDALKVGFLQTLKDYNGEIERETKFEIERQLNEYDFTKEVEREFTRAVPEVVREHVKHAVRSGIREALRDPEVADKFSKVFAEAVKRAYLDL